MKINNENGAGAHGAMDPHNQKSFRKTIRLEQRNDTGKMLHTEWSGTMGQMPTWISAVDHCHLTPPCSKMCAKQ